MTSVDLSTEPEPAPQHHYRSLTWGELAARNQYLASITSADDMMRRFERRVEFADRDIVSALLPIKPFMLLTCRYIATSAGLSKD